MNAVSALRRLIYFPDQHVPPIDQVLPGAEAVSYRTGDGLEIGGWFLARSGEGPGPSVLVLPGNAGNRAGRAPLARMLHSLGCSVLLVDYRGYGANPGSPDEVGLAADAEAALQWLNDRPETDGVIYFGESLGAAVAVGLAATHPPAALVLRSPFTSLPDVARAHYGPLAPARLLPDRWPSLERIGSIHVPLLVVAGMADSIVPAELSRRLYDAAPGPKQLVAIVGADHNDPALAAGAELREAVRRFLADHLPA